MRHINDLLADPRSRKKTKITTARTIFGRSEIEELMILAPVFQAFDKSIGMGPSCEVVIEGRHL